MRILRNILLVSIPILLLFNLAMYFSVGSITNDSNIHMFRGFTYLKQCLETFPGFQSTVNFWNKVYSNVIEFGTADNVIDILINLCKWFVLIAEFPLTLLYNLGQIVVWFISLLF